ncbi:MAG: globin domain-containing protein [Phycisphaerales bacterium]|nr:hypothetical protein [Planctomycetota bacterium]
MPVKRHPVAVANTEDPLSRVPLDTALVARLRATYERVRTHELKLADIFYAKLFAAAPHLRAMFRGDPASQAQKLTASLDAVVRNFENPAENRAALAALGQRHAGYGARPEHYGLVVDLLVDSMREVGGSGLDENALREWKQALQLISAQMIAASASPA